ncbi:MAG: MFS transporter [Actinobacteria bacterium]|nr:MAG: MFS transporter [Actinomycetota bacterium]
MFAVTYSTQAILPEIGRTFGVSPAEAGLSISAVVLALAVGAWIWGPFSDRVGRKRSIVLASALLVPPTLGAALAPSFALLLARRSAPVRWATTSPRSSPAASSAVSASPCSPMRSAGGGRSACWPRCPLRPRSSCSVRSSTSPARPRAARRFAASAVSCGTPAFCVRR